MNINPMEMISLIQKGGNPQQLMLQLIEQRMGGTPMGNNLMQLARSGNTASIEQIARNIFSQSGRDYDQEFKAFRDTFGL